MCSSGTACKDVTTLRRAALAKEWDGLLKSDTEPTILM